MRTNTETHFANTPTLSIGRSKFDRPFDLKTSFNVGELVPIFCDQVIPGDSIKMKMSEVVRMMTPMVPVMDNLVADVFFFYVPWRLIWDHTKQFVGENDTAPWAQNVEYEIPQIQAPEAGWDVKSLAVYLGEPAKVGRLKTSALKFRAYCEIYNQWFRSEVTTAPVYIHRDDALTQGINASQIASDDQTIYAEKGPKLLKACKVFDYFTGALISPQKGDAVQIPMGFAPVMFSTDNTAPVIGGIQTNPEPVQTGYDYNIAGIKTNANDGTTYRPMQGARDLGITETDGSYTEHNQILAKSTDYYLWTDLTNVTGATITALRQAFAIQKFYERAGLCGSRYGEVIRGHFSVTNPDYRNMIPEYLGGFRTPISMNQSVQTSATDNNSPLGNTGAYSVTVDRNGDVFSKSFTEWGIIMGLCTVRVQSRTYQQGQNREWRKKKWTDFYWPEFANLSNQPIYFSELEAKNSEAHNNRIFGYQEAWAEMRYAPNMVTGELRSDYEQPLDMWHYADWFDLTDPIFISKEFIEEPENNVKRTLAVQNHDMLFGDFYFAPTWTRPMPTYSIPGLIDHH